MPDPIALKPCTTLYPQFDGGYYPVPLNQTTGFILMPGSGVAVMVQDGRTYALPLAGNGPADPALIADLAAMLTTPLVHAKPGDDLTKLMQSGAMVEVEAGTYGEFTVPGS